MMKWPISAVCLILFCLGGQFLRAQTACDYRLELYDSGEDGWNGATVTVVIGSTTRTASLPEGSFRAVNVPATDGSAIRVDFSSGDRDEEVSYALFDAEGQLVFSDGPSPDIGEAVFTGSAMCPSCPAPSERTIRTDDVRAFRADISWMPPNPTGRYVVEFGPAGFTRGTGRVVEGEEGEARLAELEERTNYDYYVYGICGPEDTSTIQGPYPFRTLWANDVGISAILGPLSDCDLFSTDTVTIALANYGGQPQTLIPYKFSVNEIDGGVPVPFDGFYTGVLGKDSVVVIDFETTFNFSNPGEYEITAWTELENDSNTGNDTTVFRITSIPTISAYPYFTNFENWGSGWTVDPASRYPSWAYGSPNGLVITEAGGGSRAWVSNLNGPYEADEMSYLLSPCLDFSGLSEDPALSFDLFLDLEEEADSLIVELSIDDGETWNRVGSGDTGMNWYNSSSGTYWSGHRGWTYVSHILDGAAGASSARLRFSLLSDNSTELEGVGLDNIRIATPYTNDLAATGASHLGADAECGRDDDQLTIRITNMGEETQSGFNVAYSVNGGTTVVENVGSLSVDPEEEVEYTFENSFSTSGFGTFQVETWVSLSGDEFFPNDTTRLQIMTAQSLPFIEDFSAGEIPPGWESETGIIVTDGHGNVSHVLAANLSEASPQLASVTPAFGPVSGEDSLTFDYRYVLRNGDGALPKELVEGDSLLIQFSADCGATFTTVDRISASNHTPTIELTTYSVPFEGFAGGTIKVRFLATHGAQDYWLDIDNINVRRCPPSLELAPVAQDASGPGIEDGLASVNPGAGIGPFTYVWETGQTTRTIRSLGPDTYTVFVTDMLGCLDSIDVEVGLLTSTVMPSVISELQLSPNPSQGQSRLLVTFAHPVETGVQVFNLMGQLLFESRSSRSDRIDEMLDLGRFGSGLYLIRIRADNEYHTEKLIVGQ